MIVPFSNHYCKSLNVEIDLVVFFAKNWDTFFSNTLDKFNAS